MQYRKLFLRYVLARVDQCDSASEVAKSITILAAVCWAALAWEKVKSETISKCFRKAGILQHDTMDAVMRAQDDDVDPFIVSNECMEFQYKYFL